MSFGISLWYMLAWQQLIRGWTILELTVGWIPFGVGATAAVLFAAWLIPRLAAQWIMAIGVAATLCTNLILATMPAQQTYWAQMFPAIAVSEHLPRLRLRRGADHRPATASAGASRASPAASSDRSTYTATRWAWDSPAPSRPRWPSTPGAEAISGYRAALYFGAALAVVGLILDFAWVRMPKDEREGDGIPSLTPKMSSTLRVRPCPAQPPESRLAPWPRPGKQYGVGATREKIAAGCVTSSSRTETGGYDRRPDRERPA